MSILQDLLDKNKKWAEQVTISDPDFFPTLAKQQKPEYLWIGCSDSRVPANQIVDMRPGEIFVHRNIANLVQTSDLNCLSVIQFAVEVLGVKHIIVCGHYGCGGVQAAVENSASGIIDYWIWNIKLTRKKHKEWLDDVPKDKLLDAVCELNVVEQVLTLSHNRAIQDAWEKNHDLEIHGWIYRINDGVIKDLNINCGRSDSSTSAYESAIEKIKSAYL